MLQRPYNISISGQTLDAMEDNLVRWSTSGDISIAFSITITKNSDNSEVYTVPKTSSYSTQYLLPAATLINNLEYKIKITIWNESGQSISSDYVIFSTSSRPTITVDQIGTVGNANYTFNATYNQTESVPMRYWSVYLYNADKTLIASQELNTSPTLSYSVDNLQSEKSYYIEFTTVSAKGLSNTTGQIPFNVQFSQPKTNLNLFASNVDNAGIKIEWSIKQVLGESNDTPIFIDNEKIDLTSGNSVWFDSKFSLDSGFSLKAWIENPKVTTDTNINEDDFLIMLNGENGKMFLQFWADNRFHLFKKIGSKYYHYISQVVSGSSFYVCIIQSSLGLDIVAELN